MNRAGKLTVRPERVVCEDRVVVTGFAGSLLGWAGVLPVLCGVPSRTEAGFTRFSDTLTCRPRTTILCVFSVRTIILCGPLYGNSRERRVVSLGTRGSSPGNP